jgi:hippurate hydrolase
METPPMPPLQPDLDAHAESQLDRAIALRRELHAHPELGNELPETKRRVIAALEGLDLELFESKETSSFVATLKTGRRGPCLLLRADMDALPLTEDSGLDFASEHPGRMHACGHDAHTAMLVAAAHLLHDQRDALIGDLKLLFQSGEEGHFGARFCVEEGLIDEGRAPDAAFAIHIDAKLPVGLAAGRPGPMLAATDEFEIVVEGAGGHASMPHLATDPIPALCEIPGAIQSMVTRELNAFDPAVITTTMIRAGTANNVIPESAKLVGTIRSTSEGARRKASEGLRRVAGGIAAAHGCRADVTIHAGYPVTANDDGFFAFTRDVVTDVLGPKGFVDMPAPVMGAEDFSYILERVPGTLVFLGLREGGAKKPAPVHSSRMRIDEPGMAKGIALHAAIALRFLS